MSSDALTCPCVRLEGVVKAFPEGNGVRSIFEGVDWSLESGEIAVLLGRSGSGKSTLLNLIAGLDQPDAGRIYLEGEELTQADERARTLLRRERMGFIFQAYNLLPTLTVRENVLLATDLTRRDQACRDRALQRLELLGLADRMGSYPEHLSGGEQQRVAIAAALAHEPALLLADEPTGNLDKETALEVIDLLQREVRDGSGRSLLLVTHAEDLRHIADQILRVDSGRLHSERVSR